MTMILEDELRWLLKLQKLAYAVLPSQQWLAKQLVNLSCAMLNCTRHCMHNIYMQKTCPDILGQEDRSYGVGGTKSRDQPGHKYQVLHCEYRNSLFE